MYLHLGGDTTIAHSDIIGFFDYDYVHKSRNTLNLYTKAIKENRVFSVDECEPKSLIVTEVGGVVNIYLSTVSTVTLHKRFEGGVS